jgi:hypothetical protein
MPQSPEHAAISPALGKVMAHEIPADSTFPTFGILDNGLPSPTEQPRQGTEERPLPSSQFIFQIFTDLRGLYRWLLVDQSGQRIGQSRYGFAALAGARRDAERARQGEYAAARIAGPPAAR